MQCISFVTITTSFLREAVTRRTEASFENCSHKKTLLLVGYEFSILYDVQIIFAADAGNSEDKTGFIWTVG